MDTTFLFEGKAAIVAGGASGIGKAIAAGLLAAGGKVTILDIDSEGCGAVLRELGGGRRDRMTSVVCDIRDAGSVAKAVEEAIGKFGVPDAKAALVTLTKVLANEWFAYGISVNALCPGPANTPFVNGYYKAHPEIASSIIARTPAGRIAEPEDFVGPALFLLSSSSDWIVGEAIVCDGGKSLNG